MSDYDLSILIPAKNEEFLGRTVEDILAHIEGKTQVIVVLDGFEWDPPKIPVDPRVMVITNKTSKGQRAAMNQAALASTAKYVMKVDAHCAFDQGFDVKMMAEMKDDWTMVPTMRNLHVFNWVCADGHARYQGPSGACECGLPTTKDVVWIPKTNPSSRSYCFDETPHFQYFNEFKRRPEFLNAGDLTESMSIQGSCFMLTRAKYWELDICDEKLGSWGSQGIEVACKTWLSGGRVVINNKTWYGHMFRTQGGSKGDFGFPYDNPGVDMAKAKQQVRELFFDNKWPKQTRPLSWLLNKFAPVPGWSEAKLKEIDAWPLQRESRGILYYSDNTLDPKIMSACQKQLAKGAREKGIKDIVSVTLKPMNFGQNIAVNLDRSYVTMFKQILTGLKVLETDWVFFAESDVLYHPSHFDFVPTNKEIWYYNGNYWFLRMKDGFALHYDVSPLSGLVVHRESAIKHFKERLALIEKQGFGFYMGFEPFTHGRVPWQYKCGFEVFQSASPNIDVCHENNLTRKRWSQDKFIRKPTNWKEANIDTIPGWDNVRRLLGFGVI